MTMPKACPVAFWSIWFVCILLESMRNHQDWNIHCRRRQYLISLIPLNVLYNTPKLWEAVSFAHKKPKMAFFEYYNYEFFFHWSQITIRKSQEASAFNFDHMRQTARFSVMGGLRGPLLVLIELKEKALIIPHFLRI